jgi:hypothetical protein
MITTYTLAVRHDDAIDACDVGDALDVLIANALSTPNVLADVLADVGNLAVYSLCQLLPLSVTVPVADTADGADYEPLEFRVSQDGQGISVEALNDRGQPMGGVELDYFDNRLQALVTDKWDDDNPMVVPITEDVDARRAEDQSKTKGA